MAIGGCQVWCCALRTKSTVLGWRLAATQRHHNSDDTTTTNKETKVLTSNEQRATSNEQRATTNDRLIVERHACYVCKVPRMSMSQTVPAMKSVLNVGAPCMFVFVAYKLAVACCCFRFINYRFFSSLLLLPFSACDQSVVSGLVAFGSHHVGCVPNSIAC